MGCSGCAISGDVRLSLGVTGRVVASLVCDLLRQAEGAAASASFGVIVLGLVRGLVAGVVLMTFFLLGDIHRGISKYLMLGFCHGCILGEGGYRSSVAAVGFCATGVSADWVWGGCNGECGRCGTFGRGS